MSIILHIGLHKTASGTLQRQFFPACNNVNTLTTSQDETRQFIQLVTRTDPAYFDPSHAARILAPLVRMDRINLISNESISGPPYVGVIEYGLDHRSPVLENIQKVFPDCRVIIVLRRQDALARSLYRQYIKRGGTASITEFYGFDSHEGRGLFSRDRFRFSPYMRLLHDLFPSGVLALLFEEFISDRPAFLNRICDFIGTSVPSIELKAENASTLGPIGVEATRIANFLFRSMLNRGPLPPVPRKQFGRWKLVSPVEYLHDYWPGKGRPSRRVLSICDRVLGEVRDDNRGLDKLFKLGLADHGYY